MRIVAALLAAAVLWGGWNWWSTERAVPRPPGVVAPDEPRQHDVAETRPFQVGEYALAARARFELRARVLRRENYRFDGGAALAPVDLAIGWGPMSDSAVLREVEITQMGRFFYWKPRDPLRMPLTPRELAASAAQLHVIPASDAIGRRAQRLRPGEIVTIAGWLVDVSGPGGFAWRTSLRRDDTGDGACEIVYVEALETE